MFGLWFLQSGITFQQVFTRVLSVAFIIIFILPFHEWAHGFAANKLGDPTAKNYGRLSFNPLASIDPMGALFIFLFGFGWAKPVPVDQRYFRNPKRDMAITAMCGPLANIVAALAGGLLYNLCATVYLHSSVSILVWLMYFLYYYIIINVGLAVFNLIPIPPFDGSRILAAFLPEKTIQNFYQYQNIFMVLVLVLCFFGFLSVPLYYAQNSLYSFVMWLTSLPFKAF